MLSRTYTATTHGLTPIKIEVEVDANRGTPNLILIGLATKAVEESKERITAALINCGIRIRSLRTIVNLAPADIRKSSPVFELAIAVGMLKMYGEILANTDDTMFFGELSLDGQLKPIRGALPLVLAARTMGYSKVFLPAANQSEIQTISGITIYPTQHLQDLLAHFQESKLLQPLKQQPFPVSTTPTSQSTFDDIIGQEQAKRALEIAASGGHNLLMIGPPGAGKTMLAHGLVSILPALTESEALEVTTIYSVCGLNQHQLIHRRPFRSPHHTASYAGLVGGGQPIRPGEVSLAHRGILFLDEFTEFDSYVIESLRQPLENKKISIVRAQHTLQYPAAFTLIAAANPCPCGWKDSPKKECRCSAFDLERYQRKLSGPILDRIDLFVPVRAVDLDKITQKKSIKTALTPEIRARVAQARKLQQEFWHHQPLTNAELTNRQINQRVILTPPAKNLLITATHQLKLSARSYYRLIKVALTIAHLEEKTTVAKHHLAEALQYRRII